MARLGGNLQQPFPLIVGQFRAAFVERVLIDFSDRFPEAPMGDVFRRNRECELHSENSPRTSSAKSFACCSRSRSSGTDSSSWPGSGSASDSRSLTSDALLFRDEAYSSRPSIFS